MIKLIGKLLASNLKESFKEVLGKKVVVAITLCHAMAANAVVADYTISRAGYYTGRVAASQRNHNADEVVLI